LAGGKAKLEHYSVAAKTGTAQMVNPETRKYYPDRYLHTFFGYFPAFNPRFIIFMYIKDPKGVRYSSETLTEPFSNLTKFLLNYYQVPPDR
jgi:cell division protein FtsI/penicillin-binding protein 2